MNTTEDRRLSGDAPVTFRGHASLAPPNSEIRKRHQTSAVGEGNWEERTARIVAHEYFAKPMHALAKYHELAAYSSVRFEIKEPALDLGCGNGAFTSVFSQFMQLPGFSFGCDLSPDSVRLTRRRGLHRALFATDARALPLKTASVRTIISNNVFHGVHPGHEGALAEVARVLEPGRQFIFTVATPGFTRDLPQTRILRRAWLHTLADGYSTRMNNRNHHYKLQYLEEWRGQLARAGLEVEDHVYYFAEDEARWWGLLAMHPARIFSVLNHLPRTTQRRAASLIASTLGRVPKPVHSRGEQGGYLLIVARRV